MISSFSYHFTFYSNFCQDDSKRVNKKNKIILRIKKINLILELCEK